MLLRAFERRNVGMSITFRELAMLVLSIGYFQPLHAIWMKHAANFIGTIVCTCSRLVLLLPASTKPAALVRLVILGIYVCLCRRTP